MTAIKQLLTLALITGYLSLSAFAWGEDVPLLTEQIVDEDSVEFVASDEESFTTSGLSNYSAWEDAVYRAAIQAQGEVGTERGDDVPEPILVPEPSSFALLAGLASLLLAMTLLRWHFDRSTTTVAVKE